MSDATTVIISVYIPLTVAMIMLTMGLGLTGADFKRVFTQPKGVAIGAFAQLIALPALAFAMAFAFDLSTLLAVGLVLAAACPGGPSSNLMTSLARGDIALSVTLTAISGVVTIVTIPLIGNLAIDVFGDGSAEVVLPVGETMLKVFVGAGLPLALGFLINAKNPKLAARLEPITKKVSVVMLTLLILGAVLQELSRFGEILQAAFVPVLLMNLIGMIVGGAVAFGLKLPPKQLISIPLEVGTQNAALAIAIAVGIAEDETIAFPAVIYGLLMYFTCAAWIVFARRRWGQETAPAA